MRAALPFALGAALGLGCGAVQDIAGKAGIDTGKAAESLVVGGAKATAAATLPIGYDEEMAYGGAIAAMIVSRYQGLFEDPAVVTYVNTVGQAVALFSRRPEIPYYFGVLDTDDVNALSAPGGYVFVTRGALEAMKSEAELAGVLAHEIGHIEGRHALEILKSLKAKSEAMNAAEDAWKDLSAFSGLVDKYVSDYLEKGLPKDTEYDADQRGTKMLERMGYAASGLRDFLATLHAATGPKDARFYDTHPDTASRIKKLDALLGKLPERGAGKALAERFQARMAGQPWPPPAAPAETTEGNAAGAVPFPGFAPTE